MIGTTVRHLFLLAATAAMVVLVFSAGGAGSAEPERPAASQSHSAKTTEEVTPPSRRATLEEIRQENPSFLVRADVNHHTRSYRQGDVLSLQVCSEEDAYLHVLYKQADGKIFQIFPNSSQAENRIKARQAVEIPAADDLFRWVVGPPFGEEEIKVLAAKEPLGELSDPALRERFFNPLEEPQLKGIGVELGRSPRPWAEDYVKISTYAAQTSLDRPAARRFAVLVGIAEYEFGAETVEGMKSPPQPLIGQMAYHRDARRLADVLQEVGQFSDLRLCTNEQATRENIEELITGWLPAVSRPGDTVLLYFAGYSEDLAWLDHRGEAALYCYDIVTPYALSTLQKRHKEGKLPPHLAQRLLALLEVVLEQPSAKEGGRALYSATGIPNTMLAHWLQGLAGRQIVLVFESVHGSSFAATPAATGEPSSATSGDAKSLSMHPFSPQVARLKGLGQTGIALLAASGPTEKTILVNKGGTSPFTAALLTILQSEPGPLTLEKVHTLCAGLMTEFQERLNREREDRGLKQLPVQHPYIVNTSEDPVVLKP